MPVYKYNRYQYRDSSIPGYQYLGYQSVYRSVSGINILKTSIYMLISVFGILKTSIRILVTGIGIPKTSIGIPVYTGRSVY